jgi:hypothetical protein
MLNRRLNSIGGMMSNALVWGLTKVDFENCLWNSANGSVAFGGSFLAAVVANSFMQLIFELNHTRYREDTQQIKPHVCTLLGIGAGAVVTIYTADSFPLVSVVAEKAWKFLALSLGAAIVGRIFGKKGMLLGLITAGGAFGYYERSAVYVAGGVGALFGSWRTTRKLGY